ncbi:cell division protein FtsL [Candidatus Thiodubiliella endoseptemdiera]|uniref:Cell division protein FtsL n=1 Tax=Candidatus Thiodubiliella endoseptemdiera TaxID=2738886 RepID=A0A853F9L2_9GAMM|nr:cell division protein FtsL [Candidatus Thiodubiliella endoseptemdiera]
MLKITLNRVSILLALSIVVLSFLTIFWHHQSRVLFKITNSVQKTNQAIIAKQKQLLSEYFEQTSGSKIQTKATSQLRMHLPTKVRELTL